MKIIEGPPELIGGIAASSASYDLYDKLNVYRRNGVQEYIVWRVYEEGLDWFQLKEGAYHQPGGRGRRRDPQPGLSGLASGRRGIIDGRPVDSDSSGQRGDGDKRTHCLFRAFIPKVR